MNRIKIKPLSVNGAFQGRKFKTPAYKKYEIDLFWILPKIKMPEPPFQLNLRFGFSSASSDWDNPIKPFQDVLQKYYGFDDKQIKKAIVEVEKVQKGAEFIEFDLIHYDKTH